MQKIDFVNSQQPALNDTNLNLMQTYIENAINAQVSGDTLPIGCIVPFTSDVVPENWLLCNGQAVSRTDYDLLFSIIGTTYGVGDGSTTFNLPDLRGRVPLGKGTGTGAGGETYNFELGNKGGEYSHILTVGEMPSHNHIQGTNYGRMTNMLEIDSNYGFAQNGAYVDRTVAGTTATSNIYGTEYTGGGAAHNLLQPFEVHNFIIKARQSSGIVATIVDGLNSTSTTDALSARQGNVLNNKFNYLTDEVIIGKWINGENLYRKIIHTGEILSTTKNVQHNISNMGQIVNLYGICNTSEGVYFPLPRLDNQNLDHFIALSINNTAIIIEAGNDANFADSYVVVEYIKNND